MIGEKFGIPPNSLSTETWKSALPGVVPSLQISSDSIAKYTP